MYTAESKILTTITISTGQKEDMHNELDKTIALLECILRNQRGFTEVPAVCPITAEYILAKVLAEELKQDKYSLLPLVERVIYFGMAFEKTQSMPFCSRVQP